MVKRSYFCETEEVGSSPPPYLPLEHGEGLVGDSEVESLDGGVERHILLVEIPVVVGVKDGFVVLHRRSELHKLVDGLRNLA